MKVKSHLVTSLCLYFNLGLYVGVSVGVVVSVCTIILVVVTVIFRRRKASGDKENNTSNTDMKISNIPDIECVYSEADYKAGPEIGTHNGDWKRTNGIHAKTDDTLQYKDNPQYLYAEPVKKGKRKEAKQTTENVTDQQEVYDEPLCMEHGEKGALDLGGLPDNTTGVLENEAHAPEEVNDDDINQYEDTRGMLSTGGGSELADSLDIVDNELYGT